jgi:hypothetical protein
VADYLSRLVNNDVTSKEEEIKEEFSDVKLLMVQTRPWFANMTNFKAPSS